MHLINTDVNNLGTLGRRDEPITKSNDFKLLKHSLKSESVSCSVLSNSATLWTEAGLTSCSWDFLGKSTGAGCHSLLQGSSLTQGLNPHFCCRQILYLPLSLSLSSEPPGEPKIFPSHPSDETASLYPLTPFSWQAMGPVFSGL